MFDDVPKYDSSMLTSESILSYQVSKNSSLDMTKQIQSISLFLSL